MSGGRLPGRVKILSICVWNKPDRDAIGVWFRLARLVGVNLIGSPSLKLTTCEGGIGGCSWCAWVRLIEYFLGSSRFKRGKFLG